MIRYSPLPVLVSVAFFFVLGVWTIAPVLAEPHGSIPGSHIGDNAAGLWNVWWFTRAIEDAQTPYWTDRLFAPFGTQVSLHTHATTHSLLAWPMTAFTSLVVAHNLAILVGLVLNGVCAWLLAHQLTRRMLPSLVAGALFALSAHVHIRVLGHINLVHAWVLPLWAVALLRLEERKRLRDGVLVGVAGALVVYTDYYYAVYSVLFTLVLVAARTFSLRVESRAPRFRGLRILLLALLAVDVVMIAAISWSGGTSLDVGGFRISARGMRNPLTAMWILVVAWAVLRFPASVSLLRLRERSYADVLRPVVTSIVVFVLLAAPLLFALARVIISGDYSAPRVLWRSSPPGGDALTLVLGHPLHFLTGRWTRWAYQGVGIDMMEQSLWLGLLPLAIVVVTRRTWSDAPGARLWVAVALFFFILALGPFLRVGGFDTALPLPHALLRYLPGIGNARIPARAVVMVSLALAMLTGFALSARTPRWRRLSVAAIVALAIVETLPAPTAAQRIPQRDAIDQLLSNSTDAGAVVELPTGLRDGFGETGALDHRALVHQVWHDRPLVGGFVARLSSVVRGRYESSPVLTNLIEVSTPAREDVRLIPDAADRWRELGIAYLVVNRDTFVAARLPQEALERAGFRLLQKSGPRELYAPPRPSSTQSRTQHGN